MSQAINNTKLLLVGLFFFASIFTIGYQAWVIWPMQKCERAGAWWDARDRECLAPIPIWRLTGRAPGEPKTAAAAPATAAKS